MKIKNAPAILPIWGKTIPGNQPGVKKNLEVHPEYTQADFFKHLGFYDGVCQLNPDVSYNETQVYNDEIRDGYAEENYDDVPIVIPYIVEGSDRVVISCPGGGYLNKSMNNEGEHIAEFLNASGISCFVLWYRSYPNKAPSMFLDLQRAIRYVRFHAKDYGYDPNKIGIIGFSAGGNLCATTSVHFRNDPVTKYFPDYQPDEVDAMDGNANAAGLIYPVIALEKESNFLGCLEGKEILSDMSKREELANYYRLADHVQKGNIPQFLAVANDDSLIPASSIYEYAIKLKECGIKHEVHTYETGGHGFGGCKDDSTLQGMKMKDLERVELWKNEFVTWFNHVFDAPKVIDYMELMKQRTATTEV